MRAPFSIAIAAPELGAAPALEVVHFACDEAASAPFRLVVQLALPASVEPTDVVEAALGRAARLTVKGEPAPARCWQGVVTEARSVVDPALSERRRVELVVRPRVHAALAHTRQSRVFQDLSVVDVVASVLRERGVPFELRLTEPSRYPRLPHCVQYQESDQAFVERLLGEAGIWFVVRAPGAGTPLEGEGEVVVLADAASSYVVHPMPLTLRAQDLGGSGPEGTLHALEAVRRLRPTLSRVRHFDHHRPDATLEQQSQSSEARAVPTDRAAEVYDHEGELQDRALEPWQASVRLEQLRGDELCFEGRGAVAALRPGLSFASAGHRSAALNRPLVVASVVHEGSSRFAGGLSEPDDEGRAKDDAREVTYRNQFMARPADVPLRPVRKPRALRQVMESATVVGPEGEEIHVDAQGRVKVQFHWDLEGRRDGQSSCWVRVMQPWAGQGWGAQFLPRVGMEVAVSFMGGDVDRPVVLGALYNATHPTPFPLPQRKTQSGWRSHSSPSGSGPGGNELRFDDAAGAEQVLVHAQRDMDVVVRRERRVTVAGHEAHRVGGKRHTEVNVDDVRVVGGSEVVSVAKHAQKTVQGRMMMLVAGKEVDEGERPTIPPAPAEHDPAAPTPGLDAVSAALKVAEAKLAVVEAHASSSARKLARAMPSPSGVLHDLDVLSAETKAQAQLSAWLCTRAQDGGDEHGYRDISKVLGLSREHTRLRKQLSVARDRLAQLTAARQRVFMALGGHANPQAAAVKSGGDAQLSRATELVDELASVLEHARAAARAAVPGGEVLDRDVVSGTVEDGDGANVWDPSAKPRSVDDGSSPASVKLPLDESGATVDLSDTASIVDVASGGMQIQSRDGLSLKSKGAAISLCNGHLQLNATTITINGYLINLEGVHIQNASDEFTVMAFDVGVMADGQCAVSAGGPCDVSGSPLNLNP